LVERHSEKPGFIREGTPVVRNKQAMRKGCMVAGNLDPGCGLLPRKSGVELSNQAGEALDKIILSAESSLRMVEQMSTASTDQLKGSDEMVEAIGNMTERIKGISRSIEAQDDSNQVIAKAAEKMKDAALHVQRSSREQGEGGKLITSSLDNILEMVDHINISSQEEAKLTVSVVEEMKEIRNITEKNVIKIEGIDDIVNKLEIEAKALNKELRKFKI